MDPHVPSIPILDLSWSHSPEKKSLLLDQLRSALYDVGFLYITNHGISQATISNLTDRLPELFDLPAEARAKMSKLNSPHFLGYSGFAEEATLGKQDLREQFDMATELPVVWKGTVADGEDSKQNGHTRDFTQLYWRLRGPNQWPPEDAVPGFRQAFLDYHDAVQELSYSFVHLIEEAFGIEVGTFDHFFGRGKDGRETNGRTHLPSRAFLPPQHRIKLLKYPPSPQRQDSNSNQGVGAHKDSSGWLTFLYQVSDLPGLEVLSSSNEWLPVHPIPGTFVVNFGNAFEAATQGAVKATTHRVIAPGPESKTRYSIPFFQGLPLDMTASEVQTYLPEHVKKMRGQVSGVQSEAQSFLDPRWDSLGESQLRKWVRSHRDVAEKWYGKDVLDYYTS